MLKTLASILVFCLVFTGAAQAAGFAQVGTFSRHHTWFSGARNTAVGLADLATATGPMALILNPGTQFEDHSLTAEFNRSNWYSSFNIIQSGVVVEKSIFRLGLVYDEDAARDLIVRTAYNPEGDGTTFDVVDRTWLVGFAARILAPDSDGFGSSIVLGGNWRSASYQTGDNKASASEFDLGLTAGIKKPLNDGWISGYVAATGRNLFDAKYSVDDWEISTPQYSQLGATLTRCWVQPGQTELLRLMVAVSRRLESEESNMQSASRWGVEMKALELVSFRFGSHGDPLGSEGTQTLGAGLQTPKHWLDPVVVKVDYTRLDGGDHWGWFDYYGASVQMDF